MKRITYSIGLLQRSSNTKGLKSLTLFSHGLHEPRRRYSAHEQQSAAIAQGCPGPQCGPCYTNTTLNGHGSCSVLAWNLHSSHTSQATQRVWGKNGLLFEQNHVRSCQIHWRKKGLYCANHHL